jgi:hypothetical protein
VREEVDLEETGTSLERVARPRVVRPWVGRPRVARAEDGLARPPHELHAVLAARALVTSIVAFAVSLVAWLAATMTLLPLAWRRAPLGRRAPALPMPDQERVDVLPRKALRR